MSTDRKKIIRGLEALIDLRKWSKAEFARAAKITPQSVNAYLTDKLNPENLLLALSDAGCDIQWIKSGGVDSIKKDPAIPVTGFAPFLGKVVAGPDGKEYFEEDGIPRGAGIPFFPGNFFCLEVENDSMIDAEPPIFPGDLCVFEFKRQPKNNDIVAVHLKDNRRLVKILKHKSSVKIDLISANKYRSFPVVTINKSDVASFGVFVTKVQVVESEKRRFGLKN